MAKKAKGKDYFGLPRIASIILAIIPVTSGIHTVAGGFGLDDLERQDIEIASGINRYLTKRGTSSPFFILLRRVFAPVAV